MANNPTPFYTMAHHVSPWLHHGLRPGAPSASRPPASGDKHTFSSRDSPPIIVHHGTTSPSSHHRPTITIAQPPATPAPAPEDKHTHPTSTQHCTTPTPPSHNHRSTAASSSYHHCLTIATYQHTPICQRPPARGATHPTHRLHPR